MTSEVANVPLKDLTAAMALVRDDLLYRWMRKAQKIAAIEWRDRIAAPGVAARFTPAGKQFYGFSDRRFKYQKEKGNAPDFVNTGRFRESLAGRMPKGKNTGGTDVVTTMSIMGGALNLLSTKHGTVSETTERITYKVHRVAHKRRRYHAAGGFVHVRAYDQTAHRTVTRRVESSRSMAEEFAITDSDRAWIANRATTAFQEIYRTAAFTKGGRLKVSVRDRFRDEQEQTA